MSIAWLQGWVMHTGLMVSLLIVLILLIRRPFTRAFGANAAYALWSLPLLRLIMPGLTVPRSWVPDVFLKQDSSRDIISADPAMIAPLEHSIMDLSSPSSEGLSLTVIFLGLWAAIAVIWLAFQIYQQSRFKSKLVTDSSRPDGSLFNEIKSVAQLVGLRKYPEVRVSVEAIGPFVTGVIRPLVILPHDFTDRFNSKERQFALVHEFAHIKRRDLWAAFLTLCFRALNWPNPLVHFASHKMRIDQEAACDAFVVKLMGGDIAHSYAETLVKAVQDRGGITATPSHLALSFTEQDKTISKGD